MPILNSPSLKTTIVSFAENDFLYIINNLTFWKPLMSLSELDALTAYAKCLNLLSLDSLEPLLAEDFHFESQMVMSAITSKDEYLTYFRGKLPNLRNSEHSVFAEMGKIDAYGHEDCLILAQGHIDNFVCLAFAKVKGELITHIDLCVIPRAIDAKRTGIYPR